VVLMPNNPRGGGVSRRIEGDDRAELKEAMDQLEYPKGMSIIARTAGIGRSAPELQWDLNYLLKLWTAIDGATKGGKGAFLIYQESSLVIRAIRDYFNNDIGDILIDTDDIYDQAQQFMSHVMPEFAPRVKRYRDDAPLFSRFQIEHQIESAYARTVQLPSGGAIVIDHTEALVSVDVNSARAIKGGDIEETATRTNLEAADEVARQMRLRDLGGLIVIDFIDMEESKNRREVENRLRDALRQDRARVQFGSISKFGLMEMSRQRLKPALSEGSSIPCPRCGGSGHIRDTESSALQILRIIQEESMKDNSAAVHAQVPVEVASFLLNEKRSEIAKIELQQRINVLLVPNKSMETPHYKLERLKHDDPRLDHTEVSYKMAEVMEDATTVTRRSQEPTNKQTPVIKGVLPDAPAPIAPVKVEAAKAVKSGETSAKSANTLPTRAKAPAASGGFLGWLKNLFGGESAPAPVAEPAKEEKREARNTRESREGREGRAGERGRGRNGNRRGERSGERNEGAQAEAREPRAPRDGRRNERADERHNERQGDRPERAPRERRDAMASQGDGAQTIAMDIADNTLGERPPRGEGRGEGRRERGDGRRERGEGRGEGRGERRPSDAPRAESENGVRSADAGNDMASQDGQAAPGIDSTPERRERRSRDRYGRDRRERQTEQRTDTDAGEAAFVTHDASHLTPENNASSTEAAPRSYFERAASSASATQAPSPQPATPTSGLWSRDPVAATTDEAVQAPADLPAETQAVQDVGVALPHASVATATVTPVDSAPVTAAVAAPAPEGLPAVQAFQLPVDALHQVANSSGLQWVNSDPAKIAAVQALIAAEPKPVHVPRQRPAAVLPDEGPLILVETRKDLSEMKLPF